MRRARRSDLPLDDLALALTPLNNQESGILSSFQKKGGRLNVLREVGGLGGEGVGVKRNS